MLRFQTGSKRPLAKRKARMLSAGSLPRKWSIRKIWDSSNTWCTEEFRRLAEARSVPNGFSMMIRLSVARPASPSVLTTASAAAGGTDR